jgi:hypothetical protein
MGKEKPRTYKTGPRYPSPQRLLTRAKLWNTERFSATCAPPTEWREIRAKGGANIDFDVCATRG